MSFRIRGLSPLPFQHLFGAPDAVLLAAGAHRCVADAPDAFPDRIELCDAQPGETLLLVGYEHQSAETPYRARHAIFVRENATAAYDRVGEIPRPLSIRPISLRAFDARGWMRDAVLSEGHALAEAIAALLADEQTAYLHAHYARRGCYAARIERA